MLCLIFENANQKGSDAMRDGHYTAGDMEGLKVTPANKREHTCQTASCHVDGVFLWSDGVDVQIGETLYPWAGGIPPQYVKVADILQKKANGRGGRRTGAGRKRDYGRAQRKPYTFRLDAGEYLVVMEALHEMDPERFPDDHDAIMARINAGEM